MNNFSMVDVAINTLSHMKDENSKHTPVMLKEVLEYLRLPRGGCLVDCTLGLGGHAEAAAAVLGEQGRIIGIDRDLDSLQVARRHLEGQPLRCDFVHEDFRKIDVILEQLGVSQVDGILLDLGISSFQLDNPERGFSLMAEGPLDMRMDQDAAFSAYDLINSLSEKELSSILKNYGEERLHNRIARFLVTERGHHPIESTSELKEIVLKALPPRYKRQKIHPATRTFQAFRIAVNRELESLEIALDKCIEFLRPGARVAVISFHSLEDRIVKHKFRMLSHTGILALVTKKPFRPSEEEVRDNPRARSARLRVGEKK
ncbi:MAG TPA: 16S rRNA (cytosine(1402)-N(4))-methyltransferase RsmH [Candidatus Omnitrophota bacterium]|nr:16S rRNA (cytosine(1402)-N(4))-methyltransferase RsmH [Candidatus Omnitrophota bacterium]